MEDKIDEQKGLYGMIYIIAFVLAIISGLGFGFRGNIHTPPIPFAIEILVVPIGLLLLFINATRKKPVMVHVWGLLANGGLLAIVVAMAL